MAGPRSSGPVLHFVFPGSALHATAVARGDEVTLAAVAVEVEGLVQNFLEGWGRVRIAMMGAQMWEGRVGMVEQDVVGHGVVELGGVSKVSVGVEVEGVQRVSMHWLLDLPPSFLPWLALI